MVPEQIGKQKVIITLFILIPRTWFQNLSKALGFRYKLVLEPTKTDHYGQSYDQIRLTVQIIANKNPRELISFFAAMNNKLTTKQDFYSGNQIACLILLI